jgi:hypothetical protein
MIQTTIKPQSKIIRQSILLYAIQKSNFCKAYLDANLGLYPATIAGTKRDLKEYQAYTGFKGESLNLSYC